MSKRLLVALTAIVMGLFMASIAVAQINYGSGVDTPGEALGILRHFSPVTGVLGGNSAATILNPEGKGDVLIFPYYDVREINGKTQDFLFAIVNKEWDVCEDQANSAGNVCWDGVAAKLRFREWDKSEEVFDVDIWMSRGDVWVGVVTHNQAIPLPYGARITSPDFVIINSSGNEFTLDTPLKNGYDFPQTAFIPPGSSNLYGYIEVIGEERTYDHVWTTSPAYKVTRVTKTNAGAQIRYGSVNCTDDPIKGCVSDVPNELTGYAYLVRVADGQSHAYNAKAIANFNDSSQNSAITLFFGAGNAKPELTNAEDKLESIEFQIAKEELWGAYDISPLVAAQYSLIVTFPTKHYHFCQRPNYTAVGVATSPIDCNAPYPTAPWTRWDSVRGDHHANTPEIYSIQIWDRNENRLSPPPCYISPCPPGSSIGFPFEVNILGFYLGSIPTVPAANVRPNLAVSTGTFESGWFEIEFDGLGASTYNLIYFYNFGTLYTGYAGLPGFALQLQEYSNNAVGGWYGAILDAWYAWEPVGRTFPTAP